MAKTTKELESLLTMIPLLNSSRGMHIAKVARRLGTSNKAVLKYLDRLNMYGADPYDPSSMFMATVDDQGIFDITSAEQFRAPLHLTASEMMALRVALAKLAGGYPKTAKKILDKLDSALLPQDRLAISSLDRAMVEETVPPGLEDILATLNRARKAQRALSMVYYTGSTGQVKKRVVEPYGFVSYAGQWYMVALCREAKATRIFKAARIKEACPLEERYEIPPGFDIGDYLKGENLFRPTGREQKVVIKFSPKIARWVLERSAEAKKMRDGSAVMTIMANEFAWIARWILVYGPEAEILSPAEARAEVRKILDSGHTGQAL